MENLEEYIRKWFGNSPQYIAFAENVDLNGEIAPASLFYTLGIEATHLKEFSKETLEFFKNNESYSELVNAIRAYTQFQDIFSLSVSANEDDGERVMFNRHYCYFESLIYLRESVGSWLDGNILASLTLLRPFFELSLLHIYWYLRCEGNSYGSFYDWLDGKKEKPPFKNQLDFVFENLPSVGNANSKRVSQIKEFLSRNWKGMSTYNHTPRVDESLVSISHSSRAISFEGLFLYIESASMLLRHIIYLYILCFPMSLFPIDRVRKWGLGGPTGLFFDHQNFRLLSAYIGNENIEKMKAELKDVEEVKTLTNWYEGFPDMTQNAIEESWEEFIKEVAKDGTSQLNELKDAGQRLTSHKAHFRTLNWLMNYHYEEKTLPDYSDDRIERIQKAMKSW